MAHKHPFICDLLMGIQTVCSSAGGGGRGRVGAGGGVGGFVAHLEALSLVF